MNWCGCYCHEFLRALYQLPCLPCRGFSREGVWQVFTNYGGQQLPRNSNSDLQSRQKIKSPMELYLYD